MARAIAQTVRAIQAEGFANIALIGKTARHCQQMAALLISEGLTDHGLALGADFDYAGGTVVMPVHLAKGLEFEAVLSFGTDRHHYAETEYDGRMLYVALTRGLHRLYVFTVAPASTFLE